MKKVFWFALGGSFVGGLLSSMFSPRLIAWYFEPPVEIGINCRPAVEWAMDKLQWGQFIGTAAGALIAAILYALVFKNSGKQKL